MASDTLLSTVPSNFLHKDIANIPRKHKNVFIGSKGESKRPRADIAITGLFGGVGTAGVFGCMASRCCHKVSHDHAIADFRRANYSLLAALQSPVPPGSSGAVTCLGI